MQEILARLKVEVGRRRLLLYPYFRDFDRVSDIIQHVHDSHGFVSHPRQLFSLKNTALGELCCVALSFCCVVLPCLSF